MDSAGISTIKPTTHPRRRGVAGWMVSVATLVALLCGCGHPHTPTEETQLLRMAISQEIAGCAVVGGERYSFASDVADTVARRVGKRLTTSTHHTTEQLQQMLAAGDIDIAVVPRTERVSFHRYPSELFYSTDFVLLIPRWASTTSGTSVRQAWENKLILTDCNFRHTEAYAQLTTHGAKFNLNHIEGIDMARKLLDGEANAIVCERSEAELLKFLYRNLREVGTIEEPTEVSLIFANKRLKEQFINTLRQFATTEEYAWMVELYFGETSIAERFTQLRYQPTRVVGGISVWDDLIKRVCNQQGVDWRLMSAMAYHESRFRNDRVSHRGAVGLMQVTPIAAQDLIGDNNDYNLSDPTTNITLAARLLKRYSRALGFGDFPTTDDQMAIMVASYNCGITRTVEAQRLAQLTGGSGDSWQDVASALLNMNDQEWATTYNSRFRGFRDAPITITYTNGVMEQYTTYRNAID